MEKPIYVKNMRELRCKAHYTQADVSRKLNIQRQTYCNYENELRTPPLDIIISLAELYDVSVDYFVRGTDKKNCGSSSRELRKEEWQLLEDFSRLTANSQEEVRRYIQFKELFPS
ncbi:MAG: helix-turn-helix domain-containing protein [Lachnospiraceae bacterium]|nr:helix-turn-helix domain-containing protein [Lachnospiraceae bacterium]